MSPLIRLCVLLCALSLAFGAACGGDSSTDGAEDHGDRDLHPDEYDVCSAVSASEASTLLAGEMSAEDAVVPSSCQYTPADQSVFVLLQLRIHEGKHVGGTTQDASHYIAEVRSGAGLPPGGKLLLGPTDVAGHDGGFWRASSFSEDGSLEQGATLELWLRTGNNLILVQRFVSGEEDPATLADQLAALASALADELE